MNSSIGNVAGSSRALDIARLRVPLGFLLAALYVWRARPTAASISIGLAVGALGLLLRAAAAGHIRKNDLLATTGPYRYTRNPLYLGSTLLAAGFLIAGRDWLTAIGAAALLAGIYLPVIRREESFLEARFGDDFRRYCARVPRFVPRRRPADTGRGSGAGGFSFALYRRHREYNALLGFVLLAAVLVLKTMGVGPRIP
jgi:protein-S-isoprenylcysteine O-methyltransferase Ste14